MQRLDLAGPGALHPHVGLVEDLPFLDVADREFLEQRYRVLIEGLYGGATDIDCQIAVTYQDGRQGVLRAKVTGTDVITAAGTT